MDHLYFTIHFTYDIPQTLMQVDLCASIEMIDESTCVVRTIRRVDTEESSLLPVLTVIKADSGWRIKDSEKDSVIITAIGEAIDRHLKEVSKTPDRLKNS